MITLIWMETAVQIRVPSTCQVLQLVNTFHLTDKEMLGNKLSENERNTIEHAQEFLPTRQSTLSV